MTENKSFQNEIIRLTNENENLKGRNEELTNISKKYFFYLENKFFAGGNEDKTKRIEEEEEKRENEEVDDFDEKKLRLRIHLNCLTIDDESNNENECKVNKKEDVKEEEKEKQNLEEIIDLEDVDLFQNDISPPKIKKLKKI